MDNEILRGLNPQQQQAVLHGDGPLLIVAGAGTGKTRTLVHRVAAAIARGVDPGRILLLTFSRRAASEMLRRTDSLLRALNESGEFGSRKKLASRSVWGGTFHAIAGRLLRIHGGAIGVNPEFTIHDRGDSEDLLDVVRTELGLAKVDKRFPKKGTCLSIYSYCVNAQRPLEQILETAYPWCAEFAPELKRLFQAYVDRKDAGSVLDYDDLLLFWNGLLAHEPTVTKIRNLFDCVFVDEYQDTNRLQAEILKRLRPDGQGLTVVGDDAQSIYAFRAATVRNILDFPQEYPAATIVKLEQNYRSTPQILEITNQVIAQASERFTKDLWSQRAAGEKPALVTCEDENEQSEFLVQQILAHREAGIDLRKQAVLFRASHHSMVLEAELSRRNIPFVKYGGLKFIETAHVKDLMAFLRLAENPRDLVAGTRVLMLLPGIGPKTARNLMDVLVDANGNFQVLAKTTVPAAAAEHWPKLVEVLCQLSGPEREVPAQIHLIRKFYGPFLDEQYEHAEPRQRDLEQLEQLGSRFANRRTLLTELALDPPTTTEALAGPPHLDEDYLVLSTMHSAKGLEWDAVYVIHAADGNIPSDMATGDAAQIDEERRLFYVALTRARNWLYVCFPQRYYHAARGRFSDRYGYAQLTRFLPRSMHGGFQCRTAGIAPREPAPDAAGSEAARQNIRNQLKALWS